MKSFSVVEVRDSGYIVPGFINPELLKYEVSEEIEEMIDSLREDETLEITVSSCVYSERVITGVSEKDLENLEVATADEIKNITDNLVVLMDSGFVKPIFELVHTFEAPEDNVIELMY